MRSEWDSCETAISSWIIHSDILDFMKATYSLAVLWTSSSLSPESSLIDEPQISPNVNTGASCKVDRAIFCVRGYGSLNPCHFRGCLAQVIHPRFASLWQRLINVLCYGWFYPKCENSCQNVIGCAGCTSSFERAMVLDLSLFKSLWEIFQSNLFQQHLPGSQ